MRLLEKSFCSLAKNTLLRVVIDIMIYRKTNGKDLWHFCSKCMGWPKTGYEEIETDTKPADGKLCGSCAGLMKVGAGDKTQKSPK